MRMLRSWLLVTLMALAMPAMRGEAAELDRSSKAVVRLDELNERGWERYHAGDLEGARHIFEEMLMIDSGETRAQTFMENTQAEWESLLAAREAEQAERARQDEALGQLRTPITIETNRPTPLNDFLNTLSFASGMNFNIAPTVDARVNAVKFVDVPLSEALDTVLRPMGLNWEMANGVVNVTPSLITRTFPLSVEELGKVKALYDDQVLQALLWGQAEGPDADPQPQFAGESLFLDERNMTLVAVDSSERLDKLAALLRDLDTSIPPDLAVRYYKVARGQGARILALIEAIIKSERATPFDLERRVYLDGEDLIVRETPDRLAKIEDLLRNEGFLTEFVEGRLKLASFSLIPRQTVQENQELRQRFADRVVEQVSTFLYAQTGMTEAALEGRRIWYDPVSLTLTLTDTPENIEDVQKFLASLPELEAQEKFKIIDLRYALVDDMVSELRQLMGLEAAEGGEDEGLTTTATLRREGVFEWRGLRIVLVRVTADFSDDLNDSAELNIRVEGQQSSGTQSLQELDYIYETDPDGGTYEIYAEDIRPSATLNEGRVRLQITYRPQGTTGGGGGF